MANYLGPADVDFTLCGPPPTYLQVQIGKMKRNLKEQWNQDGKHHHPMNLQVEKSKTTKSAKFTEEIPSNIIINKRSIWNNITQMAEDIISKQI